MIQPNELRIGNLFHPIDRHTEVQLPQTGVTFKLLEIKAFGVSAIISKDHPAKVEQWQHFPFADISPIPLTDEILEKCGFKKSILYDWRNGDIEILFNDNDEVHLSINEGEYTLGRKIKYLHQLQNLYFALTGEELI